MSTVCKKPWTITLDKQQSDGLVDLLFTMKVFDNNAKDAEKMETAFFVWV